MGITAITPNSSDSADDDEQPKIATRVQAKHDRATQYAQHDKTVHHLLPAEQYGPATDLFRKFAVGDHRAGKGHTADQDGQDDGDQRQCPGVRSQGHPTNQQACQTAKPVEQGHHFRHGGHLHHARRRAADDAADHDADYDPLEVDDVLVEQGRHHGQQHANGGNHVPAPGGRGGAQFLQAIDEQDRGDDIGVLNQHIHADQPPFFLNMASMRSVTR